MYGPRDYHIKWIVRKRKTNIIWYHLYVASIKMIQMNLFTKHKLSSVQSLSRVWLCNPVDCNRPGLPVHHQLPEFTQTHIHWISDAIQPSHPLLSPLLLPSIFPIIKVFSNESVLHIRWPKYWSSALPSILPMNIQDCFPLGWTEWISLQSKELRSLLQHHSSNVLIIWCFTALFSFLYSPTLTSILDYWKNQCFD